MEKEKEIEKEKEKERVNIMSDLTNSKLMIERKLEAKEKEFTEFKQDKKKELKETLQNLYA
jgi:dihydroxyacetone kinase DhaKLM complex PTS-EIIA-like component DhaM